MELGENSEHGLGHTSLTPVASSQKKKEWKNENEKSLLGFGPVPFTLVLIVLGDSIEDTGIFCSASEAARNLR
jgi:hypothetical protein